MKYLKMIRGHWIAATLAGVIATSSWASPLGEPELAPRVAW